MLRLQELIIIESKDALKDVHEGKVLINTINAHSYNVAQKDKQFAEALQTVHGEEGQIQASASCVKYLIPDGASIVKACRWLKAKCQPKERIAGWDLFLFEMENLERKSEKFFEEQSRNTEQKVETEKNLKVMFMGSSEKVLNLIRQRAANDFPHLEVVTYSPPYTSEFSAEDSQAMIQAINEANPDLLWIGMTAPKQEKWIYQHWHELNIHALVGTIGAVFDFYAGTERRAPLWWQTHSLEWLYRLLHKPRHTWRRYVIGNPLFLWNIMKEKITRNDDTN